jgi:hypothetical protein
MKLTITLETNEDGNGWISCQQMRASFPTRNAVRDIAALVAQALDLEEAEGCGLPVVQYPLPSPGGHPAYWAGERRRLLLSMMDDPTAGPHVRFLAAAILKSPTP